MADTKVTHAIRRTGAQPAYQSRDQITTQNATGIEPGVFACQRRARDQTRRSKQRARCRNHEFVVTRRTDGDERTGLGTRDRRGEVV